MPTVLKLYKEGLWKMGCRNGKLKKLKARQP